MIQMQPLSDDEDKQVRYDDTIHVDVTGTVASVCKTTCSFWIQCTQCVCGQYDQIAVHGRMDKNRKWKQPLSILPSPNTIIALDGVLERFETYKAPNSADELTCVVVAVDDITFLQPPPD